MTPFVGRQAEIRRVWRALESGRHVVLSARYGMGRTSLMPRIAALHEHEMPFAFADLSAGSGEASRRIYGALGGKPGARPGDLSYRTVRHRVLHEMGEEGRPIALVLDELTRLTPPRLKLVADLALAGRFRIVAIVGALMPEADRESLRRRLNGAEVVSLGWLKPRDVRDFLRRASELHGFAWREEDIEARVQGAGGYPMGMVAAVENERRRHGRGAVCRVVMVD
jgi:hypothetical protein